MPHYYDVFCLFLPAWRSRDRPCIDCSSQACVVRLLCAKFSSLLLLLRPVQLWTRCDNLPFLSESYSWHKYYEMPWRRILRSSLFPNNKAIWDLILTLLEHPIKFLIWGTSAKESEGKLIIFRLSLFTNDLYPLCYQDFTYEYM